MTMISLNQIVKIKEKEGRKVAVLDHVNLNITEGEFISIVGFNKCGKTSLMRILAMIDQNYYGSYIFENVHVENISAREIQKFRMEKVGLVLRNVNLVDYFTIRENISLPLQYLHGSNGMAYEQAKYWCHRFKISHRKNHLAKKVNPLIKVKAAIAQSLVLRPKILLADDIMGDLNTEERKDIINLLAELNNEGLTIVLTSENLDEANLFHRKIFINEGKIFTDYPIGKSK